MNVRPMLVVVATGRSYNQFAGLALAVLVTPTRVGVASGSSNSPVG